MNKQYILSWWENVTIIIPNGRLRRWFRLQPRKISEWQRRRISLNGPREVIDMLLTKVSVDFSCHPGITIDMLRLEEQTEPTPYVNGSGEDDG